ncbi:Ribosomal large subunit pseudouridine synthase D [Planctomycetes bacterium Poly30]|uniref:Pseudouridine synthase n=1 Tax=Saltatorellus ferox TaxID=2528018 RepID=A0A518EME9_9BACT|nr:Ribosomal large subunit pseudouridine synthase D [Planctomycetes bacterium Poly30]
MPLQRITYVVPKNLSGDRLDVVLEELVKDLSRSQLQKLVRRGKVRVNGKVVARSNGRVPKGTAIEIEREAPAPTIEVLHQDADILVVVKPAGLLTHGADRRPDSDDLASQLDELFGPLPISRGLERPGIVHRLDRDTSGILVVARHEPALENLQDQFRDRSVLKVYQCLSSGSPLETDFTIEDPLGPVPGKADRQQIDHAHGKDAHTDFQVLQSFGTHALLACRLHTGRRHQIRVHLAARGLPVLGDPLYGSQQQRPLPGGVAAPARLALHAWKLAFRHPGTGERMEFASELPQDLQATVDQLQKLRDRV